MPKKRECPACGSINVTTVEIGDPEGSASGPEIDTCYPCGLPVALFQRFAAAMELASDPAWGIGGCVATGLGSTLSCHESLHGAMERLSRLARRALGRKR